MHKWIAGAAVVVALTGAGSAVAATATGAVAAPASTTQTAPPSQNAQAREAKLKARLDKLVASHKITQAQEDAVIKKFEAGDGKQFRAIVRSSLKGAVKVSAKTIGIPAKELAGDLKAGQSVGDVAAAHNVPKQNVVDALVAAGDKRIDTALGKGKITTQQDAALKAKVPALAAKFVDHHKK